MALDLRFFGHFPKKNIDFLTSKIEFLSKVPILKVVQNTILYIFHIYHISIGPIFKKIDFQSFWAGNRLAKVHDKIRQLLIGDPHADEKRYIMGCIRS